MIPYEKPLKLRGRELTHIVVPDRDGFFDARDLVKYEMLRQVSIEGAKKADAAALFSVSRPTFYQPEAAFAQQGLAGLLPQQRGPKRPHARSNGVYRHSDGQRASAGLTMANRNSDAIGDRFIVLQLTPSPVIVCRMRDWLVLMAHLIVTTIRTVTPGGARAVIAESLLLKHQLLILNRSRKKAPKLRALDRILLGLGAVLVSPQRILKLAVAIRPPTLLRFHRALVQPWSGNGQ